MKSTHPKGRFMIRDEGLGCIFPDIASRPQRLGSQRKPTSKAGRKAGRALSTFTWTQSVKPLSPASLS